MGIEAELPIKAPKKIKPIRRALAFWLTRSNKVLLQRRPSKGLLGGMPGLPHTPWIEQTTFPVFSTQQALDEIVSLQNVTHSENAPAEIFPIVNVADFCLTEKPRTALHTFTHFHLESQVYAIALSKKIKLPETVFFWHPIKDIKDVGLPTVFAKMAALWP